MTDPLAPAASTSYVQVPSSSPINIKSSPRRVELQPPSRIDMDDDKDRRLEAKRQAIRNHPDFPVVRRKFHYLEESDIFKGFVKGKGHLRDVTQWLEDNYDGAAIMGRRGEAERRAQAAQEQERRRLEEERFKREWAAADAARAAAKATDAANAAAGDTGLGQTSAAALAAAPTTAAPSAAAPSTNVNVSRPRASILDKYKFKPASTQARLDGLFSGESKRRRLVRRSDANGTDSGSATPEAGNAADLDLLEEKIRQNRRRAAPARRSRRKVESDSDAMLEDDDLSDDMSQEEDDARYGGGLTLIDAQILEFLNNAPQQDVVEICQVPPAVAEVIMLRRPFGSIYEVNEEHFEAAGEPAAADAAPRKGRHMRKPLGQKIIELTEKSLKGYRAVDSLIKKCSEYGELITRQMKQWGVTVTGEGELEVVEIGPDDAGAAEAGAVEAGADREDDAFAVAPRLRYVGGKPATLAPEIELKNYQQVGINWLHLLYRHRLSCILADEMGLGKTCQVIAFMALLQEERGSGSSGGSGGRRHLVVVPASTLENWLREFRKFCPALAVQAYYGLQREREELRYELQTQPYDVLVTTYNLATGAAADFKFLRSQPFDVVVYDEGHMLKNSASERYTKLMRLQARFRLLLTGTPLQNNLKELVSLLAFMLPALFVDKKEDLEGLFNQKISTRDTAKDYNPLLLQQAIAKAKTMMTPFVLRRRKDQVLKHLPRKVHAVEFCAMLALQRAIYDEYMQQAKRTRAERQRRRALPAKELAAANRADPIPLLLNVMMLLRKAALHPLLFRRLYTDDKVRAMARAIMREPEYLEASQQYIFEDMCVMLDHELHALCRKFPHTMARFALDPKEWLASGKVVKALELIDAVVARGHKVLLFSLFTQMLDILEVVLLAHQVKFVRLDGQTPVELRQDIIDQFYDDHTIPVFLLSTKAGGFGINLVAANHVIMFDQLFNPHDDRQAEDRAHRVGQEREVQVTKLISEHTIEENMLQLAQNKLALDQSISEDGNERQFEEKAASLFEKILFEEG
jgi:SWI/SNF-related matrix-associated actin-dependent regulator 1 of chromatin subfamily A